MRNQFTFYRSYYEALKLLPKKDQIPVFMAICAYALDEEPPKLTGAAAASFLLIKPTLDKANEKAKNGKLGGSKPKANDKQTPKEKPKADRKQTPSEKEKEGEIEIEKEYEKESIPLTPLPPVESKRKANLEKVLREQEEVGRLPVVLQPVMEDWLEYKRQRKDEYTPIGLTALITEVINKANEFGEGAVAQVIRISMASNYKGITFDRLQQQAGRGRKEMVPAWADKPTQWAKDAVARMVEASADE